MMNWTDERTEQLKGLWDEGLTVSAIASQLGGVTRNAIIGKVHRLKLSIRTRPYGSTPTAGTFSLTWCILEHVS
jgi:GcrA cell cycle regulator